MKKESPKTQRAQDLVLASKFPRSHFNQTLASWFGVGMVFPRAGGPVQHTFNLSSCIKIPDFPPLTVRLFLLPNVVYNRQIFKRTLSSAFEVSSVFLVRASSDLFFRSCSPAQPNSFASIFQPLPPPCKPHLEHHRNIGSANLATFFTISSPPFKSYLISEYNFGPSNKFLSKLHYSWDVKEVPSTTSEGHKDPLPMSHCQVPLDTLRSPLPCPDRPELLSVFIVVVY